ncbi:hypothetical protein [Serratia sp. BFP-2025]|uniref:hypothetical protein n=1 Tax=Serratia sp. BFP-2025 TaxID=3433707 RepID=UPI003D7C62F2
MKVIDSSMLNFVSGAGNFSDNRSSNGKVNNNNGGCGASTNYGGQANGFVSNSSAGMSKDCAIALGLAAAGGVIGGLISQGARAVIGGVVGSSIGSLGACIGGSNNNGFQNASKGGGYNGGTCSW